MGVPLSHLLFGALPLRPDDQPRVVGDPVAFAAHTGWYPAYSFNAAVGQATAELARAL
jgi:GDP-4-dehydro-6-deoxy-D-mannose reductase